MNVENKSLKRLLIEQSAAEFKKNRQALFLSQAQMGEVLEDDHGNVVERKTINRWESGETNVPAWALQQQRLMLSYFTDCKDKKTARNAIFNAMGNVTIGFFAEAKEKVAKQLSN